MPITIPANISSVLYVQMRMIACLAKMGGFNVDDQVQTVVYACLAGVSINNILKETGKQIAKKLSISMLQKLPRSVLTKINQKVGFRLLTKFGTKGIINIHKAVPVVGGVVGGAFDFTETKVIANRAYKLFIEQDIMSLDCEDADIQEEIVDSENSMVECAMEEVACEQNEFVDIDRENFVK